MFDLVKRFSTLALLVSAILLVATAWLHFRGRTVAPGTQPCPPAQPCPSCNEAKVHAQDLQAGLDYAGRQLTGCEQAVATARNEARLYEARIAKAKELYQQCALSSQNAALQCQAREAQLLAQLQAQRDTQQQADTSDWIKADDKEKETLRAELSEAKDKVGQYVFELNQLKNAAAQRQMKGTQVESDIAQAEAKTQKLSDAIRSYNACLAKETGQWQSAKGFVPGIGWARVRATQCRLKVE